MARRNSPNDIPDLGALSHLGEFVFDKRQGQRAAAKKHRRNRHYEKQFIRNTLAHLPLVNDAGAEEPLPPVATDPPNFAGGSRAPHQPQPLQPGAVNACMKPLNA